MSPAPEVAWLAGGIASSAIVKRVVLDISHRLRMAAWDALQRCSTAASMTHFSEAQRPLRGLTPGYRWLRAFLLRAAGARALSCEYCGSAIPLGEVQCRGCGATATSKSFEESRPGENATTSRQWLLPVLLCLFFPPALLVIVPVLFWRWLRKERRGWLLPLLVCIAFPPAVLIVAPALLWRPPGKHEAL